MRRHIYGLGVFLITQLLMSCMDSCGCEKSFNINAHFDINNLNAGFTNEPKSNLYGGYDTSTFSLTFFEDSAVISTNDIKLLVYFDVNYIEAKKTKHYEFITSAYACSPIEIGQDGSLEQIDSFYIVPVSGKFGIDSFYTDTLYTLSHISFSNYTLNGNTVPFYNQNYYNPFNYNSTSYLVARPKLFFNIIPTRLPATFTTINFEQLRVVLKLKNGERYEKLTNHIKII